MAEVAHTIDLNLAESLQNRDFRQKFFVAETSAQIAAQLIALRKRRDLKQQEVAELIGTQQPAISRIEKADYQSWSFSILRKIADALDARIRVYIEPSEDIIHEYGVSQESESEKNSELAVFKELLRRPTPTTTSRKDTGRQIVKLEFFPSDNEVTAMNQHLERPNEPRSEVPKPQLANSAELQRLPAGLASWR
jgi:transcriptional regulator with XRE-family HTH domain